MRERRTLHAPPRRRRALKPWKTIATARASDGSELVLQARDGVFTIRSDGHALMSSDSHDSEDSLAAVGLEHLATKAPHVLIGGLGLGYTVRVALELLPKTAKISVAEISPAVVEWNRGPLAHLAGAPLEDPRVTVLTDDIANVLKNGPFDAILLDVDNGPIALSRSHNQRLYEKSGLKAFRAALTRKGTFVLWSAGSDALFVSRLAAAGFTVEERKAGSRRGLGGKHVLFVATRRES